LAHPQPLIRFLPDIATATGLLVLAAAIRWPNLWLIPPFTDETLEAALAMRIYLGQAAPLTNVEPYIGALWNYLLAVGFGLVGLNFWLPRFLVFVGGVLTVAATWWLGWRVGGRIGGAVAGLFMAACSTHVLVNSHVGWSHSITPLFTTLGFACLARALQVGRAGGAWLLPVGLLFGLGVQTHLTAAFLLPGAALAVLVARPRLLLTRWAVLAGLAFLLAMPNLVVFNLQTGGRTFTGGQQVVADYTREDSGLDPDSYVENLGRLSLASSWILSGAIEKRRFVRETLAEPALLLYLGVAVGSIIWAAWRGFALPLLVVLPYVLILPLVNPKYEPLLNGRYLMPLLPLIFSSIGLVASDLWRMLRTRSVLVATAPIIAIVILALYPLVGLLEYERSTERTNHALFAVYRDLGAHRQPDETVLVDYGLDGVFFMAAGSAFKGMELLLTAEQIPYVVIDARQNSVADALAERSPRLLLLNTDKATPLGRSFSLTPLGEQMRGTGFALYRVAPRTS
jgi:4-amino-4-deoxy-L-arabinose transferase-like glycosyltransferase